MKLSLLVSGIVLANRVSAYGIIDAVSLNCRTGPDMDYGVVKAYLLGEEIQVICQVTGQEIRGDVVWNLTQDGCYVSNHYIDTKRHDGIFKKQCASHSKSTKSAHSPSRSRSPSKPDTTVTKAAPVTYKPAAAKTTSTARRASELGSVHEEASTEHNSPPKMTKIAPAPSPYDESSALVLSTAPVSKPNGAVSLCTSFRGAAAVAIAAALGCLL